MEIKKHFKLYKSGKQWVTAAVATVAVSTALLYGGVAHADQQDQSSTTQDQTSAVNVDTAKTVISTDQSTQTTNKNQAALNDKTGDQSKNNGTSGTVLIELFMKDGPFLVKTGSNHLSLFYFKF